MLNNLILIIDDDKELVAEISDVLTDEGYTIISAYNGKTGLNLFETNNPCLIILDMKIPLITGVELIPIFKSEKPNIPIIMISGRPVYSPLCKQDKFQHNQEEQQLRMVDQFINKPFSVEFLITSIKQILKQSKQK